MVLILGELAIIIGMILINTGERHSPEFDLVILAACIIYLVQFLLIMRKNMNRYEEPKSDLEIIDFDIEDELTTKVSRIIDKLSYVNLDIFYHRNR